MTDTRAPRGTAQQSRNDGTKRVVTSLSVFPDVLNEWKQQARAEGVSLSHWVALRVNAAEARQAG